MAPMENPGENKPRIIILSESGPLGGDLGAYLSGRFNVVRVTGLAGAETALDSPTFALLLVSDRHVSLSPRCLALVRRAVADKCRVLLVGFDKPDLEADLRDKVLVLPELPSPQSLFEGLGGNPLLEMQGEG